MARNSGEIEIRKMLDADLARVNYIDGLLFGEKRVPTWPFSFGIYWAIYRPKISFVAEVDGEVVGFIVGHIVTEKLSQSIIGLMHTADQPLRHDKVGCIDMIGISPEYQGRGAGRALVEAFHEECKRNKATMRGFARESDERLTEFLTGLGFKRSDIATYEKD